MWAPSSRRSPPPKRSPAVRNRTPNGRAANCRAANGRVTSGPAANHGTAIRRGAHRLVIGMAAAAILPGCAVGPNQHRTGTPVDAQFANAGEAGLKDGEAADD